MRKVSKLFLIFLLLIALVSCANFIKVTYVTLNESKDLYDLAMTTVSNLQKQGMVTEAQRAEINKVAKIYKEAHNTAVDALATYKKTSLAADKDKVIVAVAEAAAKWSQVAKLINAIKPGIVPATFSQGGAK